MNTVLARVLSLMLTAAAVASAGAIVVWLWVVLGLRTHDHPIARRVMLPVACSLRGCITTSTWYKQHRAQHVFAEVTGQEPPTAAQSLTSVVRQHLVAEGLRQDLVKLEDAQLYREEVLQSRDAKSIQEAMGFSIEEYDRLVVLPLLRQEALLVASNTESYNELFQQLARQRSVFVFPLAFSWNREEARVVEN